MNYIYGRDIGTRVHKLKKNRVINIGNNRLTVNGTKIELKTRTIIKP